MVCGHIIALTALFVAPAILAAQTTRATRPVLPELERPPDQLSTSDKVKVTGWRFEGNTIYSDSELATLLQDYVGRDLALEQLEQARQKLTLHYVNAGYINSGAVLPEQTITDGVIQFDIVEGRISEITLHGRKTPRGYWSDVPTTAPVPVALRPGFDRYVKDRIRVGAQQPLNIARLREKLELVRQNPRVARINAELRPGPTPGTAVIEADVEEAPLFQLGVELSNKRAPSVGAERIDVIAAAGNVSGYGDSLSLRYDLTKGGWDEWELSCFEDFGVDYTVPVSPHDTTVSISFSRSDSLVVEAPFTELDIVSESSTAAITFRHPLYRSTAFTLLGNSWEAEVAISAGAAIRQTDTFLLGERFSFSPGDDNGRSNITALRVGQELYLRNERHAIAARSTFSIGVDAIHATEGNQGDSQFFAWLGQVQYVRRLFDTNVQGVARASVQLATDVLPPVEQFSVGGIDTVRGYRENQLVRDNGAVASFELQIPLIGGKENQRQALALVPFVDIGYGWNHNNTPPGELLYSAGVGLVYTPNRHFTAQVYYGYAFNDFDNGEEDNLQDLGIHFDLMFWAF